MLPRTYRKRRSARPLALGSDRDTLRILDSRVRRLQLLRVVLWRQFLFVPGKDLGS